MTFKTEHVVLLLCSFRCKLLGISREFEERGSRQSSLLLKVVGLK